MHFKSQLCWILLHSLRASRSVPEKKAFAPDTYTFAVVVPALTHFCTVWVNLGSGSPFPYLCVI